ncbi:CDK5 regulatory subunit associated protein 1 [Blomia tropicalis]|nr:CDK5 regulatory subunit associated protein 1 [Blomia tropicalis]
MLRHLTRFCTEYSPLLNISLNSVHLYHHSCVHHHQNKPNESKQFVTDRKIDLQNKLKSGPNLQEFIQKNDIKEPFIMKWDKNLNEPYIDEASLNGNKTKVYIKTYGCQMNVNDTEIASTILEKSGYEMIDSIDKAEIIFLMTCAIRENAELKVWHKLRELERAKRLGTIKQFGLLGCMAERLKSKVLEDIPAIDIIAGPDSYRHLPKLLAVNSLTGQNAINVLLSLDETYSDVLPNVAADRISSFVSITRGCNNMCSYCIVPYTRGRERSRRMDSILKEVEHFINNGVKEIVLLGQNVNSYRDLSSESTDSSSSETIKLADGFRTIYKLKTGGIGFDILLDQVAQIDPNVRIRFTSPHPKDFNDNVIEVIARHPNIANGLHMPAQSGSDHVLERMRRGYTKQAYLDLVDRIRLAIPDCAINSDFICGFCGETNDDHRQTLDLMERVGYNIAYIFAYSMRDKTYAHHHLNDDVPHEVKITRLTELNQLYRTRLLELNRKLIGTDQLILLEGVSKKSDQELYGRNEAGSKVIIPSMNGVQFKIGDFVRVRISDSSSVTLRAEPIGKTSITEFYLS